MATVRRATHAGSWYTNNASRLEEELDGWLRAAGLTKSADVRGVIAPHAGYSYSGRSAAFAFGNIDPTNILRVFLLGPSHHYYTPKCALTRATTYSTPIGDLPVDQEVIEELKATGKFEMMDLRVDEAEHSMEMHLPYLAKVFKGYEVKVVPILVGALSSESEAMYGSLLAKYIDDPKNFFSVSSDFCHWGSRFSYTYYDKKHGSIYKSIEALDRMGMEIIETGDADSFKRYLQHYENTICGRHPISVFLHALNSCSCQKGRIALSCGFGTVLSLYDHSFKLSVGFKILTQKLNQQQMLKNSSTKIKIGFLHYEQSSQCKSSRDSSVSYASAAAKVDN